MRRFLFVVFVAVAACNLDGALPPDAGQAMPDTQQTDGGYCVSVCWRPENGDMWVCGCFDEVAKPCACSLDGGSN